MNLCNRTEVKRLLDKYGLAPRKGYGQNFLINPAVPQMIAENSYTMSLSGNLDNNAPCGVIEIGPGVGALTSCLAQYYDKVAALEIDKGLIPLLEESMRDFDNVKIICQDVMETDIPALIEEEFGDIIEQGGSLSVCANLPYYITSPVIMKLLESFSFSESVPFSSITVMIQTEVADRLVSEAGSGEYGAVTAAVRLRADVKKIFNVSAGNFYPIPKVSSSVISIIPHGGISQLYPMAKDSPLGIDRLGKKTCELISLAFGQRRKTIVNSAASAYPKELIVKSLRNLGLREDIRGERLSASDFLALADNLNRGL